MEEIFKMLNLILQGDEVNKEEFKEGVNNLFNKLIERDNKEE